MIDLQNEYGGIRHQTKQLLITGATDTQNGIFEANIFEVNFFENKKRI